MRAEQTCEIVRDLMPLLAEGLVAPKTEAWMKEHLEECPECKAIFETLMKPESITPNSLSEKQLNRKVNFMKKIRRTTVIRIIVITAVICAFCFGGFYLLTQVKFYVPTKDMTVAATPSWKADYQPVIIYAYDVTVDKKYGKATLEDVSTQLIPDEEMGNIEEYSFRIYYTLWDYLFRANRETTLTIDIRGNYPDRASMIPDSKDTTGYDFYMGLPTPTSVFIKGVTEYDRFVLWENLEILDATNKILERSADPEAVTVESDGMQVVFEIEEVVLRTDISEKNGAILKGALYPTTPEDIKNRLYYYLLVYEFSSEELKVLSETGIYSNTLIEMTGAEFSGANFYGENAFTSVPEDSIVQIMNATLHVSSETPIPPCIGTRAFRKDDGAYSFEWLYNPEIATEEEYRARQNRIVTFVNGHREVIQY